MRTTLRLQLGHWGVDTDGDPGLDEQRVKSNFEKLALGRAAESIAPELSKARFEALSRLVPLMYFILLANACVLAFTFLGKAPRWLTVYPAGAFAAIFLARTLAWWKRRGVQVTFEYARRQLLITDALAAGLAAALVTWGFALFPMGDAHDQGHVAFFLAFTMISSMFCLIHAWPAPLWIALFAGVPFVMFFAISGILVFVAVAIDVVMVTIAALVIIRIQHRHFTQMVVARAEAGRQQAEQGRLLRMIEDLPIAVMTVEPRGLTVNYANRAALALVARVEHLLPIKGSELLGSCIDIFHKHPEHQRRLLADPSRLPHRARIPVGPEILELNVSAITGHEGEYLGPMVTLALVTAQVEAERRVLHLAHHDTLTGLLNRYTLRERLQVRLGEADGQAALLVLDLDGFKTVNDTLGHRSGDLLLAQVAARLEHECAGRDAAVARLGGDEFAVLLANKDAREAESLARVLLGSLCAPYELEQDRQVRIGASIGIALAPQDGDDCETLLSRADIALYAAKSAGRGTIRLFSPDMLTRIHQRVSLERRLRSSLDSGEGLFVFFQPIVDLSTGRVTAREALIRWHDANDGWVSPADFVPVAEESRLIDRLGGFVLQRACLEAMDWADGARVAVNISAAQLGKGTLRGVVLEALAQAGLPASRLEVEITETALLLNGPQAVAELLELRELGVRVALDDFGTGYSSLSHLRTFTFDKIKIDGSFVREALVRAECAAVVRVVAELGSRLGVTTVAEGVETQAHLDHARAEGCVEAQGYFLGRPAPSPRDFQAIDRLARPVARGPLNRQVDEPALVKA
jgi:diguanylate cyclase (GGDEF)-like protein